MAAGRYDLAEPLLRDALEILRSYGDRDSRLAILVSNLGGVLYETGDYAKRSASIVTLSTFGTLLDWLSIRMPAVAWMA